MKRTTRSDCNKHNIKREHYARKNGSWKPKHKFDTKEEADLWIKKYKMYKYTSYICSVCNKWHIGIKKNNDMKTLTNWIYDGLDKPFSENKDEVKHYVDGILVSEDNKILILRRANYMKMFGGHWGFVGGSVDKKDKDSKEAIIREVKEETGLELTFNEKQNMKAVDKQGHEREDGLIGSDTEYWLIKLETTPAIKISREHSKYEWVGPEETKERNRKFMPDVFHYIQKYFNEDL